MMTVSETSRYAIATAAAVLIMSLIYFVPVLFGNSGLAIANLSQSSYECVNITCTVTVNVEKPAQFFGGGGSSSSSPPVSSPVATPQEEDSDDTAIEIPAEPPQEEVPTNVSNQTSNDSEQTQPPEENPPSEAVVLAGMGGFALYYQAKYTLHYAKIAK